MDNLNSGFMGFDGNWSFFFGIVEDRNDPLRLGRMKVRVFGIHPADKNLVSTEQLPWAMPIGSISSAGTGGVGTMPVGAMVGSYVVGFFADGKDAQIPFVFGTIAGGLGHIAIDTLSVLNNSNATDYTQAISQNATELRVRNSGATYGTPKDYAALATQASSGANEPVDKIKYYAPQLMSKLSLTSEQAASIFGNLWSDSQLVANALQNYRGDNNTGIKIGPPNAVTGDLGYGWGQWSSGRISSLVSLANSLNINPQSDQANFLFLLQELQGSHSSVLGAVKGASTVKDCTTAFMNNYYDIPPSDLTIRIKYANQAYNIITTVNVPRRGTGLDSLPKITNT